MSVVSDHLNEDAYLQQQLIRFAVPAAIEITDGDGRVRHATVGIAADSRLYTASVTKQVTATIAAIAVTEGAITEQTPLRALLPRLPSWAEVITVQHLVHHTAGLPSTGALLTVTGGTQAELDNHRILDGLAAIHALEAAPGTAFHYSNLGYVLLAEMLEHALAAPLPQLAERLLFQPLGIGSACWTPPPHEPKVLGPDAPPRTLGDGGLWISAHDLRIWLDALNQHRLQPDISNLVNTPGSLTDGTTIPYAWGATRRPHPTGTRYTHGGDWPGWTTKTLRQPRTRIAIALLTRDADPDAVTATVDHIADQALTSKTPDLGDALD